MKALDYEEWCEKYFDHESSKTGEEQYDAYLDELGEVAYEEFRERGL